MAGKERRGATQSRVRLGLIFVLILMPVGAQEPPELLPGKPLVLELVPESGAKSGGRDAIKELPEHSRAVVVLRGVEQLENHRVAQILKKDPNTVAQRWRRALAHLRKSVPDSIFDEID